MHVIYVNNVNEALPKAIHALLAYGVERESRNGPVLAMPMPVATAYENPTRRVLFSHLRRANPVFHLMESLWMLQGRNDVAWPATFVKNMRSFSDDGRTFHGAYGYRWRNYFGNDQLRWVIDHLRANPDSRRAVVQMWDGAADPMVVEEGGKDVPCNTSIYFDMRDGRLNMLVSCRSNDAIWGCYGANVVHMSVLQEYVAAALGVPVGVYTQMSNDLHVYLERHDRASLAALADDCHRWNYYAASQDLSTPLFSERIEHVDEDLSMLFSTFDFGGIEAILDGADKYQTGTFANVIVPMLRAWHTRDAAVANTIAAPDWRIAVREWLEGSK